MPQLKPSLHCAQALEKYNIEKDVAAFIKKEFDKKYNPTWHCIVGRNFGKLAHAGTCVMRGGACNEPSIGMWQPVTSLSCPAGSYVTHETKHFIYFYLGKCWIRACLRLASLMR